jgi:hypothetical protein
MPASESVASFTKQEYFCPLNLLPLDHEPEMGSAVCQYYDTWNPNLGGINIHAAADKRAGFKTKVTTYSRFFN